MYQSRKYMLPSDRLTNKQRAQLNGSPVTYKLNRPMSWEEFKALPHHVQTEYVQLLMRNFKANATRLADMFGINVSSFCKYFKTNELGITFTRGNGSALSREQLEGWSKFVDGEKPEEELHEEPACDIVEQPRMQMGEFSMSFYGNIDPIAISNSITKVLGTDSVGQLDITFRLDRKESYN